MSSLLILSDKSQSELLSSLNPYQSTQVSNISQPLNVKLNTLDTKSNKLLQKVLAIQQQIQKYTENQHKQLLPFRNFVDKNTIDEEKQSQHQLYMKKMANIGRNKIKMIESIEHHIVNLQHRFNQNQMINNSDANASHDTQTLQHFKGNYETEKVIHKNQNNIIQMQHLRNQLDKKFSNYDNYQNNILKHSKSQKFSFKQYKLSQKYLNNNININNNNKYHETLLQKDSIKATTHEENRQSLEEQLIKLRQQFAAYQERTSKQVESYKNKLNKAVAEKDMLRRQMERQQYEHLKEKLFNKNYTRQKSKLNTHRVCYMTQRTSRDDNNNNPNTANNNMSDLMLLKLHGQLKLASDENLGNQKLIKTQRKNCKQVKINECDGQFNKSNKQRSTTHNNSNAVIVNSKQSTKEGVSSENQKEAAETVFVNNDGYINMVDINVTDERDCNNIYNQLSQQKNYQLRLPLFQNLQQLRDELSMCYVQQNQENEQILELREQVQQCQQYIQQLQSKLHRNHALYSQQLQQLHLQLQSTQQQYQHKQHQLTIQQQETILTQQQTIKQLKQQIHEMNEFIYQQKEENQNYLQQIQHYKQVVEQFLQELGNMKHELSEKLREIQRKDQMLGEAQRINKQCEQEILIMRGKIEELMQRQDQYQTARSTKDQQIQKLHSQIKQHPNVQSNRYQPQKQQHKHHAQQSSQRTHQPNHHYEIQQLELEVNQLKQMMRDDQQKYQMLIYTKDQTILALNNFIDQISHEQQQLQQQNKKLNQTVHQISHINKSLQIKEQELNQSIHLLRENISQEVQKEVDEAIRTFLRYRKNSSRLIHNNHADALVYNNKTYLAKRQIDSALMQAIIKNTYRGQNNNNNSNGNSNNSLEVIGPQNFINSNSSRNNIQSHIIENNIYSKSLLANQMTITLRKLMSHMKQLSKQQPNTITKNNKNQLRLKLTLIVSLIQFAQSRITDLRKSNSHKHIQSLVPESICLFLKQNQNKGHANICKLIQSAMKQGQYKKFPKLSHHLGFEFVDKVGSGNNSKDNHQCSQTQKQIDFKQTDNTSKAKHKQSLKVRQQKKQKSLIYLSPQVLLSMNESEHSYTWSIGVIIDQLIHQSPFYTKIQQIVSRKDNYRFRSLDKNSELTQKLQYIMQSMLRKNFKQRPCLQKVQEMFLEVHQLLNLNNTHNHK